MPVIGFLGSELLDLFAGRLRAFRRGLNEMGFVEGRNYSSNTTGRRVEYDACRLWQPTSFAGR